MDDPGCDRADHDRADHDCADHGCANSARRVGRPRSTEADEAILAAAADEFAERGYEAMGIEAIAERAGVAKSTIYRRYPGKPELVRAVLSEAVRDERPTPDTGSLEGDLVELCRRLRDKFTSEKHNTMLGLIDAATRHPELQPVLREFIGQRRRWGTDRVRRAIAEGELSADADPEAVLDMAAAPVFYRAVLSGGPLDDDALVELVRRAVAAHRP